MQKGIGPADLLRITRRRIWWILTPAIVMPLVALGIAAILPKTYTSKTLVLVEQQKVPDAYVKSIVTEELNYRLSTMQEQILSRTSLQPLIEKFGLYQSDVGKVPMETLVDKVRKNVAVEPLKETFGAHQGLPGFSVSFTSSDPRIAQQVCAELTSLFMKQNLQAREEAAQGTTDFLRRQLEDSKRDLDQQDAKLAGFKQKYFGQLPEQEQTNMAMLATLNTQLEATSQALMKAQQDVQYYQALISQQATVATPGTDGVTSSSSTPDLLQQRLAQLQTALADLQTRYTPNHPDVLRAKSEIEAIKKEIAAQQVKEPATSAATKDPKEITVPISKSPQIEQLRLNLHQAETAVRQRTAEQADLQKQIHMYQSRLQMSPEVEERFKELTRDYQTALSFYNDLLAKKTESEMATDLERKQQGEQFSVLDPPNLPEKPTFPNVPAFGFGGLALGIALGIGLAAMLEMRNQALETEIDLEQCLQLPVLMSVPMMRMGSAHTRTQNLRFTVPKQKAGQEIPLV